MELSLKRLNFWVDHEMIPLYNRSVAEFALVRKRVLPILKERLESGSHYKTPVMKARIQKRVANIENKVDETEYMCTAALFIHKYEQTKQSYNLEIKKFSEKKESPNNKKKIEEKRTALRVALAEIFRDYKETLHRDLYTKSAKRTETQCENCKSVDLEVTSQYIICNKCHHCKDVVKKLLKSHYRDSETLAGYTISKTKRRDSYLRSSHFTEHLRQLQAKTRSQVCPILLAAVKERVLRFHIDPKKVTIKIVKRFLKELNYASKYEIAASILKSINPDAEILNLTSEEEEIMLSLFLSTERSSERWKRIIMPKRKNTMSYSFVAYQLAQMLGYDRHLKHFRLLKSPKLLSKQVLWWSKVCEDLGWTFQSPLGNILLLQRKNKRKIEYL